MVQYAGPTGTPEGLEDLGYTGQTWDKPWNLARGQISTIERMPSAILNPGGDPVQFRCGTPLDLGAIRCTDPLMRRDTTVEDLLRDRMNNDGIVVIHRGEIVAERYANGLRADDRHVVHSCSKTLTTMMVGIAIHEGRIDPEAEVSDLIAELGSIPAWEGVTVQHVLDMAAGLDTEEHYENADSMYWRYADAVEYYTGVPEAKAIGVLAYVEAELVRRSCEPGTVFNYASYLTNLLPIMLERAYGRPAVELYEEYLYSHLGAEAPATVNLDRLGNPIVEGQVNLTLRDLARWAYPFVNAGRSLTGYQVVPEAWVEEAFRADTARQAAFAASEYGELIPGAEYHNQAWLIGPQHGTLAMLGIHGQFAYMNRALDLLVVGMSSFPDQANAVLILSQLEMWNAIAAEIAVR